MWSAPWQHQIVSLLGASKSEQQLELLQAGKVRTGEDIGVGWIDPTEESIERAKARLIRAE